MKNLKNPRAELFRLSKSVWDSVTFEDIIDTSNAMKELGIFNPPLSIFDIECPGKALNVYAYDGESANEDGMVDSLICHYNLAQPPAENHFDITFFLRGKSLRMNHVTYPDYFKEDVLRGVYNHFYIFVLHVLIVVLASKNIVKKQSYNEPRSRSHQEREDSKNYNTTTTIKIGEITEYIGKHRNVTGRTVRPHLRRGHIRTVGIGEGRKETKKIFIQPCFVNADRDWVAVPRKSYNLVADGKAFGI